MYSHQQHIVMNIMIDTSNSNLYIYKKIKIKKKNRISRDLRWVSELKFEQEWYMCRNPTIANWDKINAAQPQQTARREKTSKDIGEG